MKISYNWLKDYIDLKGLTVREVSDILTEIGLECEAVISVGSGHELDEKVVVGFVVSVEKHPNADKLTLCKVDIGNGQLMQIVCGAPNVEAGQKVPVALHGALLKTFSGETIRIKRGKIRGEVSEGMICAEDELCIGNDHSGIMVLDPECEVGSPVSELVKGDQDYILEIGITPNRADAMSHYGVARDLAAALQHRRRRFELSLPSVSSFKVSTNQLVIDIEILDRKACKRYAGVSILGVKVGPSPEWLQNRLTAIGLHPINNIVDVTNYVLHECGHPLHAFDADKIKGRKIVVRKAKEGEKFTTLDGVERTLSADDLMICDIERPLVLAGIYGGLNSGVSADTVNVFLESAVFDPVHIRRSAKSHGLSTDASFRYERGVDPEMTIYALKRAAILIRELAGGEVSMNIADEYPVPIQPHKVDANLEHIRNFIGSKSITNTEIKSILASLEIKIVAEIEDTLRLEIPAYRVDVQREADVAEEIVRIYGLDNIEIPKKIKFAWHPAGADHKHLMRKYEAAKILAARGYTEVMNNSLTRQPSDLQPSKGELVTLLNPLSSELSTLRTSMLYGLLETIRFNINRQIRNLRLFEFGKTYHKTEDDTFEESDFLALASTGHIWSDTWMEPEKQMSFYHLMDQMEALFRRFKLEFDKKEPFSDQMGEGVFLHCAEYRLGKVATVHDTLLKNYDIQQPVYYAEIDWKNFMRLADSTTPTFSPIPKHPEVIRDLALVIDRNTPFIDLEKVVQNLSIRELKSISLFDIYEGKNLPPEKKSYALRFALRHDEKTLTDQEIEDIMSRILAALQSECGAALR
ncbi:MAG: phenylalanine--tRNA ligase subunit beta [Thermaurantimonas sp.]